MMPHHGCHCQCRRDNYRESNTMGMLVFTMHGNRDDPTGVENVYCGDKHKMEDPWVRGLGLMCCGVVSFPAPPQGRG